MCKMLWRDIKFDSEMYVVGNAVFDGGKRYQNQGIAGDLFCDIRRGGNGNFSMETAVFSGKFAGRNCSGGIFAVMLVYQQGGNWKRGWVPLLYHRYFSGILGEFAFTAFGIGIVGVRGVPAVGSQTLRTALSDTLCALCAGGECTFADEIGGETGKMYIMKKTVKGIFTVEAAFLFPVVILLTVFCLQTAIALYGEVAEASEDVSALRELDCFEVFWRDMQIDKVKEAVFRE